jgi:AcrR family transcriptional regulator
MIVSANTKTTKVAHWRWNVFNERQRENTGAGEQLCMHRGFTGMGLSELLKTAEVPKGSFYHYFHFRRFQKFT